jgi:DNA polymerase V
LEVYLGYRGEEKGGTGKADLPAPTDRFDLLLEGAKMALRQAWIPGARAQRMHLLATRLHYPGAVQRGLFDPPAERAERLARLKREVNARHGRFALRSGATLPLTAIYRDEANDYDICDVHGKIYF